METATQQVLNQSDLLKHWKGHRMLTRKLIEAFPEQELFTYSVGGMRPFAGMVMELIAIGGPGVQEIVTGQTEELNEHLAITTKDQLLQKWDESSELIQTYFPQIPAENFGNAVTTFGKYKGTVWSSIFYFIDNEIHHRGQGYVYLRALGIEPPYFWDR